MTYSYTCPNGHSFDVRKMVKDLDRIEACPECGEESKRNFLPTNFVFKTRAGQEDLIGKSNNFRKR